ncbi:hypothetical protein M2137_000785 [Parabacteroides sp. PFB2-10]|nr:hypothetical protein [Parabacteroides sp. PFB2-10]
MKDIFPSLNLYIPLTFFLTFNGWVALSEAPLPSIKQKGNRSF